MEQQQDNVIERYMVILACGERMLQCASEGAWEDLITRESGYLAEIEQLAQLEQDTQLDAEHREAKQYLLVRIRDTEQQLCAMLQTRMSQLSEFMTQSRNQLRVHQAYESGMAT